MPVRSLTFVGAVAVLLSLVQAPAIAQSLNAKPAKSTTQTWTTPRTVDGQPDLQGVWANKYCNAVGASENVGGARVSDRTGSGGT
jgi:hypothetical protein